MKIKLNLKNKKLVVLSILASILVITGIVCFVLNQSKVDNYIYNSDLKRAEIEQMKTYDPVKDNESQVEGCPNVEFDAFFTKDLDGDGYTEGVRGSCIQIGNQDTIYMELQVNINGELKNARIDINSDNFYFETVLPKSEDVVENAISDNTKTIHLKNIGAGKQITLTGNVKSGVYSSASRTAEAIGNDITKLSNNENSENRNSITLTGTYVIIDENGNNVEKDISKTVYFDLDWHGTTHTSLPAFLGENYNFNYKDQDKNLEGVVDEEKGEVKLSFEILTREDDYQLNLSKSEIEIEIPKLNGCAPKNVEAIDADVEKILNQEEIIGAKVTKTAILDENGEKVQKEAYTDTYSYTNDHYRYNKFKLIITYPIEAYDAIGADTIQLIMPVKAYYEGYNNTSEYFMNPYKSEVAEDSVILTFSNPQGRGAIFHVRIGKYRSYPWYQYMVSNRNPIRIWNGIGENIKNDTYEVRWEAYTGTEGENKKLTIKENNTEHEIKLSDELFVGNESISMEDFVSNVGIYFGDPTVMLGKDGWIKIYDDDDEESEPLVTFTINDWNKYNKSNPYRYDEPVKHIRVETSETKSNSTLYVYNIKEIDTNYVTDNFSKEDYLKYDRIRSRVNGYADGGYVNEDINWAYYQKTESLAQVSLSNNKISTTETHNLKIYIDTLVDEENNQEKWKNGMFLLKLPKELTSVEIKDVYTENKELKNPLNYEIYVEDGYTFIKIITENVEPTSYRITVDCDVTPDSTSLTQTKPVELYAINENCENYPNGYSTQDIYDLNDNSNFTELVNYLTTSLNLISTNNLLTSEYISNYDKTGTNKTYSPKVAGVSREDRTARINVVVNNNYSGTNSEVIILGRIPFKGNKYVEENNENDMKSEFTAIMNSSGIVVPEELKNIVTVYYSENGEATTEFNETNDWQDAPMDFSKVKSYMIYFDKNYKLQRGEQHEFYYDVTIPKEVVLNTESYSHHEVSFCWDTPQGKRPTKVRPGKVGITPVEKFNLQLTKFQTGIEKRVPGAYYSVTEIKTNEMGEEERINSKSARTKEDGTLIISDLNIDRLYEIKEIKSPDTHELNSDTIRILVSINDETGELYVEKKSGKTRTDIIVNQEERIIYLEVEDNPSAKLKIQKTDKDNSEIKIANVRYKIIGDNLPESGSIVTTNKDGIAEIQGLTIGKKYILQETKAANGYYLEEATVEFTILTSDYINYDIEVSGNIKDSNIEIIENSPAITFNLTNERIPIFKIVKTDKNTGERLGKVKYKLTGKGFVENGSKLITNEQGEIQLSTLYLNEEYILEETKALEGYYTKAGEIKFQILNNNGNYSLKINSGEDIIKSTESTYTNGIPTLILYMENERIPTFNLDITKIEKDNLEVLLQGAKFRLYRDEKLVGEAISNEQGKLEFKNLYQYEEGKDFNSTYTLTEAEAPNGYTTMKDITFRVQNVDGILKFIEESNNIESPRSYEVVENTIKLVLENSPSFKLIKVDGEKKEEVRLPNTKFVIYNIDTDEEVPAVDSKGNIVGIKETIDRNEYYTLTTDSNGEFTVDLAEGFYKAIEVKANSEKFDITNQTYYFGIGKSKKSVELKLDSANSMLICSPDMMINTVDGGTIRYRNINRNEEVDIGNGNIIKIAPDVECEGVIAKYDSLGNLEWYNQIKISEYNESYKYHNFSNIHNIIENSLGEIIVKIVSTGKGIQVADNNIITNPHTGAGIDLLVKYDNNGNVLDYTEGDIINCSDYYGNATSYLINNDVVFLELNGESFDIGNGNILRNDKQYRKCDGHYNGNGSYSEHGTDLSNCDNQIDAYYNSCYMIKYNENKEIEWYKKISANEDNVNIQNILKFGDEYTFTLFSERHLEIEINFGNKVIPNQSTILYDINQTENEAIVTPYSILSIDSSGFWAYKHFEKEIGSITLPNGESVYGDADVSYLLIRFNSEGVVQWYTVFDDKLIEDGINYNEGYTFANETKNNGYIIGTVCRGKENRETRGEIVRGKLIKYDSNGNIEWEKTPIEYDKVIVFNGLVEVNEGYLVQVYVDGDAKLDNDVILDGTVNYYTVMYDKNGNVKWTVKGYLDFQETSDNGFIVGIDKREEKTIDFGNGIKSSEKGQFYLKYNQNGILQYGFRGAMWEDKIDRQEYILQGRIDKDEVVDFGNNIVMKGPTNFFIQYASDNSVITAQDAGLWERPKNTDSGRIYLLESNKDIEFRNGTKIHGNGNFNTYLIKCNSNLEIEWYKTYEEISFLLAEETSDGGIITVVDNYYKEPLNLGNGVYLDSNPEHCTTALIKFNKNGIAEWAKSIEDAEVWVSKISEQENNIIQVEGEIYGTININDNKTIGTPENYTNILFRYTPQEVDTQVEVESAYQIGGDYQDFLNNVVTTEDGGYITSGSQTTSENGSLEYIITKYDSNGTELWKNIIPDNKQILSIDKTSDNGCIVIIEKNYDENSIIRYDSSGIPLYEKILDFSAQAIMEYSNGEYIIVGSKESISIPIDEYNSIRTYDGILIKYKENDNKNDCEVIFESKITGNVVYLNTLAKTEDGGIVAGGYLSNFTDTNFGNGIIINPNSEINMRQFRGVIAKYNSNGIAEDAIVTDIPIRKIESTSDGGYIVLENSNILASTSIVKFNKMNIEEWSKYDKDTCIYSVIETSDGGYIYTTSRAKSYHGVQILEQVADIIKLDRNGNEEWRKEIESNEDYMVTRPRDIKQHKNGKYILVGEFCTEILNLGNRIILENKSYPWNVGIQLGPSPDEKIDVVAHYYDAMILTLDAEKMIPEKQEITVSNFYKRHNITTEVKEVNGEKGGTISGEGLTPYEKVIHGDASSKPIEIKPDEYYELVDVTINGEKYSISSLQYNEEKGIYTMPKEGIFANVLDDIHIVVTFCYTENKFTIKKIDSQTKELLKGAKFQIIPMEDTSETELLNTMQSESGIRDTDMLALTENTQEGESSIRDTDIAEEMVSYSFIKSEDGSYKSNNQGKDNTTATSRIEVDLSDFSGDYYLEVNAGISSSRFDEGRAYVTRKSSLAQRWIGNVITRRTSLF